MFQGDATFAESAGTLTWSTGTGKITLSGATNPQTINFLDKAVEDIEVNKTNVADVVQFTDGWQSDSFDAIKGTIDFNGETFTTFGDFRMRADSQVIGDSDAMDGVDINVGGDIDLDGLNGDPLIFKWETEWSITTDVGDGDLDWVTFSPQDGGGGKVDMLLQIDGAATASNTVAEHSDASGYTEIDATDNCTDNGNNTNWDFVGAPTGNPAMRRWGGVPHMTPGPVTAGRSW